jgi:hypothetical protein
VNSRLSPQAATQLLSSAINQICRQCANGERAELTPRTILVGAGSPLDSLLLLNFLVAVEERLSDEHGLQIDLIDLLANAGHGESPLKTIATLADHLVSIAGAS